MPNRGPVFIVPWRCTFTCDGTCVHCASAGKFPAEAELDTKDAKRLVDQVADFGATFFGVTGGQPFLRDDLFEVLDYATQKGLCTSIITDGRLLGEKEFRKIVKNQTRISVSIDGSQETNDAIRGKGAYEAAICALERFAAENLLNVLVYTFANAGGVTNVNEADIRHVLDLAKKYNARWVVFHGMIPYSSDKTTLAVDPTPAQYEWLCNKLYDLNQEYRGSPAINVYIPFYARVAKQRGMPDFEKWYSGFFLGRCFFGKFMSIAENGDAIPCSYNDAYRIANIKNKSIKQIWQEMQNDEFFKHAQDKSEIKGKCGVCEYKQLCGGCRTAALYYTRDIFGSDPRCSYIPAVLVKKEGE